MKHLLHLRALLTLARDLYRYPHRGGDLDAHFATVPRELPAAEHSCARFAPQGRRVWTTPTDCPVCKRHPEYAALVADLKPVAAADFDLEPTPLCEAVREHMARIDAACADWAREVRRCADAELAEMTGGGEVA